MDASKLKVGTKVLYGGSIREVITIEEDDGRVFLTYSHQGRPVAGRIDARLFSPGAVIVETPDA